MSYLLTKAQAEWLADITEAGVKLYNGRGRRTIERLEKVGVVEVEWQEELAPTNGPGSPSAQVIAVWPTGAPSYRRGRYEDLNEWRQRVRDKRSDDDPVVGWERRSAARTAQQRKQIEEMRKESDSQ